MNKLSVSLLIKKQCVEIIRILFDNINYKSNIIFYSPHKMGVIYRLKN